jgi:exopolyphosphatase/guanosine-5'-triphosphate,3'-diphosphate pyrophosphatase
VVPYDPGRIHGAQLTREEVIATTARLAALPLADRRRLPALDPARADVIVAGGILIEEILSWAGTGVPAPGLIVSDRGVRWGLARRLC